MTARLTHRMYHAFCKKRRRWLAGFTIVEVLVVVSIIGVAFSFVISATISTKTKSRDAERLQDLKNIRTALELFYSDHGYYPNCWDWGYAGGCDLQNFILPNTYEDSSGDGTFMEFLRPYMGNQKVLDPLNDQANAFVYIYATNVEYPVSSGKTYPYGLVMRFEKPNQALMASNPAGSDPLNAQYGFYLLLP